MLAAGILAVGFLGSYIEVFDNLVAAAGGVSFRVAEDGQYLIFTVSDTGTGFSGKALLLRNRAESDFDLCPFPLLKSYRGKDVP